MLHGNNIENFAVNRTYINETPLLVQNNSAFIGGIRRLGHGRKTKSIPVDYISEEERYENAQVSVVHNPNGWFDVVVNWKTSRGTLWTSLHANDADGVKEILSGSDFLNPGEKQVRQKGGK